MLRHLCLLLCLALPLLAGCLQADPTPAPTAAPSATAASAPAAPDVTPAAPLALPPQTIAGWLFKTAYNSAGVACVSSAADAATLRINADGSAQLSTVGRGFIEYDTCTPAAGEEGWYVDGRVVAGQTVVAFSSCNFGQFSADGTLDYGGDALVGTLSCTNADGVLFVRWRGER